MAAARHGKAGDEAADLLVIEGRGSVDEMLVVPTEFNMFWDSTAQMASLVNLMMNAVFVELGPQVEKRIERDMSATMKTTTSFSSKLRFRKSSCIRAETFQSTRRRSSPT